MLVFARHFLLDHSEYNMRFPRIDLNMYPVVAFFGGCVLPILILLPIVRSLLDIIQHGQLLGSAVVIYVVSLVGISVGGRSGQYRYWITSFSVALLGLSIYVYLALQIWWAFIALLVVALITLVFVGILTQRQQHDS